MDEAQRKYIISILSNEVMKEPTKYGLQADGILRVGDRINLSSLFRDTEKLRDIFAKAEKLTPEQKQSVLENNRKIGEWVKNHPTEVLSTDKVNEILSSNPKPVPTPAPAPTPKIELPKIEMPELPKKPVLEQKPNIMPRSMATDSAFAATVEAAFTSEINGVYSSSGVMGLGKTEGIASKEWLFMSRLPVSKVLDYFTGDSNQSDLPPETKNQISKSEKHHELVKQILGLMDETRGVVKPYENETVSEFLKRLGGFVMKNHTQ